MPELDDLLTQFRDSPANPGPDPAALRQRGDRRRRRQQAMLAGGVAAVVAAIALPLALGGSGSDEKRSEIPPAAVLVTSIPRSIDLTDGLPAGTKTYDRFDQNAVMPCGASPFDPAADPAVSAVRSAVYTDPSEGGSERGLAIYSSATAAGNALEVFVQSTVCSVATGEGWQSAQLMLPEEEADLPGASNQAVLVFQHIAAGEPDGEGFVVWMVQAGNALLFESAYANGLGSTAVQYDTFHQQRFQSLDLVRELISTYGSAPDAPVTPSQSATPDTPTPPAVLGHDGAGQIRLGMSLEKLRASDAVTCLDDACTSFRLAGVAEQDGGTGCASKEQGVMAIFATAGMRTPEGLAIGDTVERARTLYPDATKGVNNWGVEVPGYDDRYYTWLNDRTGTVNELVLQLRSQTCFG